MIPFTGNFRGRAAQSWNDAMEWAPGGMFWKIFHYPGGLLLTLLVVER
jgi:hypothetical protein